MSRARALTDITLVLQQNTQSISVQVQLFLVRAAEFRNHSPGMIPPPETARANGLLSEVIPLHVSEYYEYS